jgi:hypothetical protein
MTDSARQACRDSCTDPGEDDPCSCETLATFDIGFFMLNMAGRYFNSGGTAVSTDLCQSSNDCADIPPIPAARDVATLH